MTRAAVGERNATFPGLHERGFFIIPNAWDAGSAIRPTKLSFRAIASTSAGAAWAVGKEDGEMSRDEVLAHLRMLVDATPCRPDQHAVLYRFGCHWKGIAPVITTVGDFRRGISISSI